MVVLALQKASDLSRVYPTFHPITDPNVDKAGIENGLMFKTMHWLLFAANNWKSANQINQYGEAKKCTEEP